MSNVFDKELKDKIRNAIREGILSEMDLFYFAVDKAFDAVVRVLEEEGFLKGEKKDE